MESARQNFVSSNIHLLYNGLRYYNYPLQHLICDEIRNFNKIIRLYYDDDEIDNIYNILINSKCLCGAGHNCENERVIIYLSKSFTYKNTYIDSGYHYICRGDNIYVDMLGNIEITTDDCIVGINVNNYEFINIIDLFK
jgi:hypothetical protein